MNRREFWDFSVERVSNNSSRRSQKGGQSPAQRARARQGSTKGGQQQQEEPQTTTPKPATKGQPAPQQQAKGQQQQQAPQPAAKGEQRNQSPVERARARQQEPAKGQGQNQPQQQQQQQEEPSTEAPQQQSKGQSQPQKAPGGDKSPSQRGRARQQQPQQQQEEAPTKGQQQGSQAGKGQPQQQQQKSANLKNNPEDEGLESRATTPSSADARETRSTAASSDNRAGGEAEITGAPSTTMSPLAGRSESEEASTKPASSAETELASTASPMTTIASATETASSVASETPSTTAASVTSEGKPCDKEGWSADPNSCSRFKRCVPDENTGKLSEKTYECSDNLVFDANTNTCTLAELTECKAKPDAKSDDTEDVKKVDIRFFLNQSGVISCSKEGVSPFETDCKHFYSCTRVGPNSPLKGELLKCPTDYMFDETVGKCVLANKEPAVSCKRTVPNPLLFLPSPLISTAKTAGPQFIEP